jgi:hypothetical protein
MNTIAAPQGRLSRWIAVASLGLVFACGGGERPPQAAEAPAPTTKPEPSAAPAPSAPAPQSDATAQTEPAPPPAGPPVIRLIEPGAAPRQKLRYKFAAGPSQWMQLDMKMTMDTAGKVVAMPTVRTVMRLDPKSVTPEGDLNYEFESTKVEVLKDSGADKALVATLEGVMSKLVGMKGSATVTPRGLSKDVKLLPPPDAPESVTEMVENMKQSMDQLYSPFPEEEVGKGAKWEVEKQVATASLHLTQKSEHLLRDVKKNTANMDVTISQEAPKQDIKAKKLAGAKVTLDSMHSTGKGKMALTLDKLVPKSNVAMSVDMAMQVEAKDNKFPMNMKMQMEMNISPTTGKK